MDLSRDRQILELETVVSERLPQQHGDFSVAGRWSYVQVDKTECLKKSYI
jgi:hypothetical protein